MATITTADAKKLRVLYQERDAAKRAWETAKRTGGRGTPLPYYEELQAVEAKIDALLAGGRPLKHLRIDNEHRMSYAACLSSKGDLTNMASCVTCEKCKPLAAAALAEGRIFP